MPTRSTPVLACLALLAACAPRPEASDAELRLRAELAAMPVELPAADGIEVTVHRWPGGPTAAGASIVAVTTPRWTEASSQTYTRHVEAAGDEWPIGTLHGLVHIGQRWRTDDRGRAVVPKDVMMWGAIAVDGFAHGWNFREPDLVLRPRRPFTVHVEDADGRPAAGVPVRLYGAGANEHWFRSTTDAQGACRLELDDDLQGCGQLSVGIGWPLREPVRRSFAATDVAPGTQARTAFRLRLPPLARLEVHATDATGRTRPLTGVSARSEGDDDGPTHTPAIADGVATLCAVPGSRVDLWLHYREQIGRLPATVEVKAPAGGVHRVTLEDLESNLATVRVLTADGAPMAQQMVALDYCDPAAHTDDDGRVHLVLEGWRSARRVAITAFGPDGETSLGAAWLDLPAAAGATQDLGDVRLAPEPELLRGRVVGEDGAPVVGALVTWTYAPPDELVGRPLLRWPCTRSAADGTFVLRALRPHHEHDGVNVHTTDGRHAIHVPCGPTRDVQVVVRRP